MKSTTRSQPLDVAIMNRIPLWVLTSTAIAIFLGIGIGGFVLGTTAQNAEDQKTVAESKAASGVELAGENLEACMDPAVVQVLQQKGYGRVCELAVVVQTQSVPGKQGERGPGPTQQQINDAVDEYFRTHPLPEGKRPTIEQVITAVGEYLRLNPPAPGRPPTPDEIAMASASYLAEHAEDFQGPKGDKGDKGDPAPPPSAEQIQVAVASYCAVENRCRGAQGPQGVGVTGAELKRDDQQICTLYFTLENPANGQVTQIGVQVRDEMCEPLPIIPTR